MEIVYKCFRIRRSFGLCRFDLVEDKTYKTGKNEGKSHEDVLAYGISLRRAFEIILDELTDRQLLEENESITINKYIEKNEIVKEQLFSEIKSMEALLRNEASN